MPPVPTAARSVLIGVDAPCAAATALPAGSATAAPPAFLGEGVETTVLGPASGTTATAGASEPAALEDVAGEPCPCGHTIVLAVTEAALLLPLAHGLTIAAVARQLGLTKRQVISGVKTLRTLFGVERLPHLVDSAIRWGLIDPDAVAPIRPARPSRDLKTVERGALANAAAGLSAEASAKILDISTGRVHKVLAETRDVLLARDTTHAVTLGHRLRLLPDTHPHLATHGAAPSPEEEEGAG